MMCFSLITVRLLYVLFQLSQSTTVCGDFIFHLWKGKRDMETVTVRKNRGRLLAMEDDLTWSPRCKKKYALCF